MLLELEAGLDGDGVRLQHLAHRPDVLDLADDALSVDAVVAPLLEGREHGMLRAPRRCGPPREDRAPEQGEWSTELEDVRPDQWWLARVIVHAVQDDGARVQLRFDDAPHLHVRWCPSP